jgi:uncharacterized protein YggE
MKKKGFLSLLCCLLSVYSLNALEIQETIPKLTVRGTAKIEEPANELSLSIAVVNISTDASTALSDNSKKVQAVIEALKKIGLDKSDFQTGQFSISPQYKPYPKEHVDNWKQEITGYEVSNSINIRTDKIDIAGKIIDAVVNAGANNISNISFGLKDSNPYRTEVLQIATKNAIDQAETLADAAQQKIKRVLQIEVENGQPYQPRAMSFSATPHAVSTPIESGNVELTATVLVTYEIENK